MQNDKCAMKNKPQRLLLVLIALTISGLCLWPGVIYSQSPLKMIRVIVDPGHGGQDTGGRGSGEIHEKEVTLALAKKLVQALAETGTVRPVLTRTDDYSVSLDERAGLANHRGGDLLISLHLGNSFVPVNVGFSLYYWSPATAAPTVSPPSNQPPPWDQEQLPYWERSQKLAAIVQQELLRALPSWHTGGVLEADLYLLRRVQMPAVLVELGSLNRPEEAVQLQKPAFQEIFARALVEAIIQYRQMQEKELLVPGPKPE